MTDDKLLKKIGEMMDNKLQTLEEKIDQKMDQKFIINNSVLLDAMDRNMDKRLQDLEERLEEKLSKKIEESQEDTIETLSELINVGYNLHEVRIQRVEKELHLPPLKQN